MSARGGHGGGHDGGRPSGLRADSRRTQPAPGAADIRRATWALSAPVSAPAGPECPPVRQRRSDRLGHGRQHGPVGVRARTDAGLRSPVVSGRGPGGRSLRGRADSAAVRGADRTPGDPRRSRPARDVEGERGLTGGREASEADPCPVCASPGGMRPHASAAAAVGSVRCRRARESCSVQRRTEATRKWSLSVDFRDAGFEPRTACRVVLPRALRAYARRSRFVKLAAAC